MGTTLKELVYDIGGGMIEGSKLKAIHTGGPGGGLLPKDMIDTTIGFESMSKLGSPLGAGGMIVIDETSCLVDLSKYFLEYTQSESCGKCFPCRDGTRQALRIIERICEGKGKTKDIQDIEDLATLIKATSLCGLGQAALNPIRSVLKYFRDEFVEHIETKLCRAGVCWN